MTRNFASLALARLYEKQGYIDDALGIYRAIDTSQSPDAQNIFDAISRLEAQTKTANADCKENLKEPGQDVLTPHQAGTKEDRMAHMLEIWIRLIVMQKRVDIFKNIKARL
ncbi:hypothetical protein [Desulfobacter vibrioformis]|uniref:hypothetical protein n=1 Tax=Desulfobacter vibrioformis TaxID=34031 RepID=UPI0005570EBA|nr:hypothetical protein [Desulfobacter vibrioformis]